MVVVVVVMEMVPRPLIANGARATTAERLVERSEADQIAAAKAGMGLTVGDKRQDDLRARLRSSVAMARTGINFARRA
jgi:hypothetical protein